MKCHAHVKNTDDNPFEAMYFQYICNAEAIIKYAKFEVVEV